MTGLFGSPVLEVAIGLAFVYLLLSLICTAVNEWLLSYVLKLRATNLRGAISGLLSGQPLPGADFLDAFHRHSVISRTTSSSGGGLPSYLSPRNFTTAILDIITPTVRGVLTFDDVAAGVNELPDGEVKRVLLALLGRSRGSLETMEKNIEAWYEDAMDRASGVFKRRAQAWAMVIAVIITLTTNADTIAIATQLWQEAPLRAQVVALAEQRAAMPRPTATVEYTDPADPLKPTVTQDPQNNLTEAEKQLLGQLLGWKTSPASLSLGDILGKLPGWLLTAIAVSLGAPFWFDVLNRFISIRNAGKVPAKSEPKG